MSMNFTIEQLTNRFLAKQAAAPESVDDENEVQPHEITTGFRASATQTWHDAIIAFSLFNEKNLNQALPADWNSVVSQMNDIGLTPLCVGNIPQRVRDIACKEYAASDIHVKTAFHKWHMSLRQSKIANEQILGAGIDRLLGNYQTAEKALNNIRQKSDLLSNEIASLKWHQGEYEQALAIWQTIKHPASKFNQAVCFWAMGKKNQAESLFNQAANELPENSGWSHLASIAELHCS